MEDNTVYILRTVYDNGEVELNGVFDSKEKAVKMKTFISDNASTMCDDTDKYPKEYIISHHVIL